MQLPQSQSSISASLAAVLSAEFQLVGELGRGGMGVVYRARELASGREVALKVVIAPSKQRLERFRREGELVAALNHPNVVSIHSAGETGGQAWLAYALVENARSLDEAFEELEWVERLELMRDVARGVGHAHKAGVVHRDLKPENVLVDASGTARVTDFGLAIDDEHERMTRTGAIVGTPNFMSPEQIAGPRDQLGPPTDVWALGVILYLALTSELPFEGDNLLNLAANICEGKFVPPRQIDAAISTAAEAVCLRALQRKPTDRYADADALADDLDRLLAGAKPQAGGRLSRGWLVAAALAPLILIGVLGAWVTRGDETPPAVAVTAATSLLLTVEPLPETTAEEFVWLEGAVEPPETRLVVTRGTWKSRVRPRDGRFRLRVPLGLGNNSIAVSPRKTDAGDPWRATIERLVVPTWFKGLRKPPALPLPSGIRFGDDVEEYVNTKDQSVLVWVPPGSFRTGSSDPGILHGQPAGMAEMKAGFFIGKYEVTWAQFRRGCRAQGLLVPVSVLHGAQHSYEDVLAGEREARTRKDFVFRAGGGHPAFHVSWETAVAYCSWAGLRLPSELEWEYAARGADGRAFPWGDAPTPANLNATGTNDGHNYPAPVGSFPQGASPFGAQDMAGNVMEWVQDRFVADGDRELTEDMRVIRGGAYNCILPLCKTTHRDRRPPTSVKLFWDQGFRVARSATD